MSLIGKDGKESKDGKEGKDGKDDSSRLAGMEAIGLPAAFDRSILPVKRQYVRVEYLPSKDVAADVLEKSNRYWGAALDYGLVDSVTRTADGATHLVLAVRDEDEAKALLAQDPGAQAGIRTATNKIRL